MVVLINVENNGPKTIARASLRARFTGFSVFNSGKRGNARAKDG